MGSRLSPLAGALGIAVAIAAAGVVVTVARHGGGARQAAAPVTGGYHGGLVTLAPDAPSTATPAPPSPPPGNVDLLWRTVAGSDSVIEALDWTGAVRGRLALPRTRDHLGELVPSPDGQRLLLGVDGNAEAISAQGQVLGIWSDDTEVWADDSRHLCTLEQRVEDGRNGGSEHVVLRGLDGTERTVTTVSWPVGDGGPEVVACSEAHDLVAVRVALGDDSAGHVVEIKVARLSTGAVLRDVHPPEPRSTGTRFVATPGSLDGVVGSPDGHLLALTPYTGSMGQDPVVDQVVDTATGRVLGHVKGWVFGFNGDGSLAFTTVGAVDWRTGRVVWTPKAASQGVSDSRPGRAEAVVVDGVASSAELAYDYLLLRPDGSTLRLACCGVTVL